MPSVLPLHSANLLHTPSDAHSPVSHGVLIGSTAQSTGSCAGSPDADDASADELADDCVDVVAASALVVSAAEDADTAESPPAPPTPVTTEPLVEEAPLMADDDAADVWLASSPGMYGMPLFGAHPAATSKATMSRFIRAPRPFLRR